MSELRLGDVIDDYCVKCRRLTNHSIVSMVGGDVAKVRCRSCYHDHDYLREQAPPSKKDLKKAELFNAVLGSLDPSVAPDASTEEALEAVLPEVIEEPEEAAEAITPAEDEIPEHVEAADPAPAQAPPAPKKKTRAKKA